MDHRSCSVGMFVIMSSLCRSPVVPSSKSKYLKDFFCYGPTVKIILTFDPWSLVPGSCSGKVDYPVTSQRGG